MFHGATYAVTFSRCWLLPVHPDSRKFRRRNSSGLSTAQATRSISSAKML